jgi:hypothetical protein
MIVGPAHRAVPPSFGELCARFRRGDRLSPARLVGLVART